MITIAVISDTHAHLDSRIIKKIAECDIAVHAGDVCGVNILEKMQPKKGIVYAVAGNNDPYCHDADEPLPKVLSFKVYEKKITIEHGHEHGQHKPDHDSLRQAHADAEIIIYGHTHKKVIDKSTTPWVLNPGAAGNTRTHGGPSCLVIKCHKNSEWEVEQVRFTTSVD